MTTFIRVIQKSLTVLLYILLAALIFTFISSHINKEQPNLFGYQMKIVLSGSMEPDIKEGSIIFMKLREADELVEVNDVVTFLTEEEILITHRIVAVEEKDTLYVTKGDANDANDVAPVHINNIVGTYTGLTIPFLGYLFYFVTTKEGIIVTLIIPGVCLLLYSVVQMIRTLKTHKQQENEQHENV
ncbi:MAG TPA: signal peptidase I [Pseudogracilibacillus sp.]|nr:signal peptidase I [Pseudogracilibacillus sp.]